MMQGQRVDVETTGIASGNTPPGVVIALGGFPVLSTTQEAFALDLFHALAARQPRRVFFANTNFIVQCQALRMRMREPSVRIVNDGIGMDLAARLIHGRRFAGNLNGTDLIPYLCRESAQPLKFFLLGGRPGVGKTAAATLTGTLGQQVVGMCDGYGEFAAAGEGLTERINRSGADVLLVAFGNPLQERWILDHSHALGVPLVFGVGALLDFLSGTAKRAPEWVRRLHLEWMYRLLNEPRRLLKRYSWDLLVFFRTCLRAGKQLP
ncbi:WecB/TagA/CpsF family glycosyltransferase [Xanthomonas oryzae pv. oryzae]|uniref:WecB/TagA/CpsF family glycosyltransferase n=1 Tax=Xanthomonas oryzae pv. leersiae TaxID=3112258 RepID=A0AAJ6KMT6_9XANT|nr:WecB/TagA/CpsF family glycosyltransferase [Xanthomonas oryzae]AOS03253.1 polysaccharide biosynthesis protein GumM [Xanthomonas oryzae pv. oryzae]AOS19893.1 polysaccharide biosynthesis protein GumM [Xanthomonas oryzae pv. oryzae]AOS28210.1 polysaccharide biosynthesis protein GumM [Xanthomonas oryzae pv. oryzae]AOS32350.1 polysaccharide biosynthesis protein GumM [Xanthomonas oryzae pv. oryzae]AQU46203.1 polysaccharide biosynthesis protein GumM [Xanthomonas oryzae pv. oryzae]